MPQPQGPPEETTTSMYFPEGGFTWVHSSPRRPPQKPQSPQQDRAPSCRMPHALASDESDIAISTKSPLALIIHESSVEGLFGCVVCFFWRSGPVGVLLGALGGADGPGLGCAAGSGACWGAAGLARWGGDVRWLGASGSQRGWAMARSARAPGCCSGRRSRTRLPVRHTRAGRCQNCQRSRLGAARRSAPVRQAVWNQ